MKSLNILLQIYLVECKYCQNYRRCLIRLFAKGTQINLWPNFLYFWAGNYILNVDYFTIYSEIWEFLLYLDYLTIYLVDSNIFLLARTLNTTETRPLFQSRMWGSWVPLLCAFMKRAVSADIIVGKISACNARSTREIIIQAAAGVLWLMRAFKWKLGPRYVKDYA